MKPLQIRETLLTKGVRTFTTNDFNNIFRSSSSRTKYFLERQTEEGLLIRLKQGIYALKTDPPSDEEIANSLYRPSYISFEYALAYWGMIPEMPYTVTSATTKPTRQFIARNISFSYYSIKEEAYTGYTLVATNRYPAINNKGADFVEQSYLDARTFYIAEPEKALVDYLYFESLGKRLGNDRLYIKKDALNKQKLRIYALLYKRKRLVELLKEYL